MVTCGIYRVYHIESGKSYIGQSFRAEYRVNAHFKRLRNGNHHCKHLQAAFSKYGESAFASQIVEACSKESLVEKEQIWIDNAVWTYGAYNSAPVAGSTLGFKHSEQTKARMSESQKNRNPESYSKRWSLSDVRRKKVSDRFKGVQLSEEHRNKIGEANRKRVYSEETLEKLREAGRRRKGEKRSGYTRKVNDYKKEAA